MNELQASVKLFVAVAVSAAEDLCGVAGALEPHEPGLGETVDRDAEDVVLLMGAEREAVHCALAICGT